MISFKLNVDVKVDRKVEIQLPEEVSEGFHELLVVIDDSPFKEKKSLTEFIGTLNWPVDGLEYQNTLRAEWEHK